jgi:hypothetical protein
MKGHDNATVLSHLIRFGFFKDYTVWTFHDKRGDVSVGASSSGGGNSSRTNAGGPPTGTTIAGDNNDVGHHDYMTMDDLFGDDAGDKGGDEDVGATLLEPEDVELFENIANHLDKDDVLFGNPRWLKNFREMKQSATDPLYEKGDCSKHMTTLRFNLKLLIVKARYGFSVIGFNEMLNVLNEAFPEGNKVPVNTYQAKKLIRLVAMILKKFDAYTNHCILYRGEYDKLESCPHYNTSRWKMNAGCHVDDNPSSVTKKTKKTKQNYPPQDEEEEGLHTKEESCVVVGLCDILTQGLIGLIEYLY